MANAKNSPEDPEVIRRRLRDHENANDLVPGTAHDNGPKVPPSGGTMWEGLARSAKARLGSNTRQTAEQRARDREALDRYPDPGGYVGAEPCP